MAAPYQLPPRKKVPRGGQQDGRRLAPQRRHDPLAFLEFATCQICGCDYNDGEGPSRRFYMTSCGHFFCGDKTHGHHAGTCTFCRRQNIQIHELDDSIPQHHLLWFQPTEEILRVMEGNINMMKFQLQQLTGLARSQRQKIAEDKRLIDEAMSALRTAKEETAKIKRAQEDLTRQCREMRAQRDAAVKQAEDLQAELMVAKSNAADRRAMPPPRTYPSRGGGYPRNPTPMGRPMMEPPQHPDDNPFDPVPKSRKRPFDMTQEEELDVFKSPARANRDFRNRPGTAAPQFYGGGGGDSVHSGMGFAPPAPVRAHSSMGYGNVNNNLEQFRYRRDATAGGPMSLPQATGRPSFSLADPTGGRKSLRPSSAAQHRYASQSRNAFRAPTRFESMDPVNEGTDDVDIFQS